MLICSRCNCEATFDYYEKELNACLDCISFEEIELLETYYDYYNQKEPVMN